MLSLKLVLAGLTLIPSKWESNPPGVSTKAAFTVSVQARVKDGKTMMQAYPTILTLVNTMTRRLQ
jgi:hypothetical protein